MLVVGLTGAGGCTRENADHDTARPAVTRTARKGPVAVTLSVAPRSLDLEEHAWVQVEIVAEKGVTVSEIAYGRTLSEGDRRFEYRAVHTEKEIAKPTEDGKLRWRYRFELEFFLPGEHELPGAEVSFVDLPSEPGERAEEIDAAAADVQTLTTEPVTIVVRPSDSRPVSAEELRNITRLDPVDLPREWGPLWWIVPVLAVVVAIGAVSIVRRLRRRRAEAVFRIPAHEWARDLFAALIAEDLIARGQVQEFYYRVSAIVRGYIERRFGVHAPEMTTEEFLTAVADDRRFGTATTDELNRFLGVCDIVKYARHQPGSGESDAVFKAAVDFVERTRKRTTPTATCEAEPLPTEGRAA